MIKTVHLTARYAEITEPAVFLLDLAPWNYVKEISAGIRTEIVA